jgi:hypothetical protein
MTMTNEGVGEMCWNEDEEKLAAFVLLPVNQSGSTATLKPVDMRVVN